MDLENELVCRGSMTGRLRVADVTDVLYMICSYYTDIDFRVCSCNSLQSSPQ